jgi:hypothetical protein
MSDTGCVKKHDPLLLHDLGFLTNAGAHLLSASYVTSIKSYLCTVLPKQNTIKITLLSGIQITERNLCTVYFNWNTSVSGHKQRTVDFTQRKPLPGSSENSSVSNNITYFLSMRMK